MRVVGEENLAGIRDGAILTCNHFSIYDNLAVKEVADRIPGRHRLYKVIKGANFFLPGMPGFLMRHCDTEHQLQNDETFVRSYGNRVKQGRSRFDLSRASDVVELSQAAPHKAGCIFLRRKIPRPDRSDLRYDERPGCVG